MGQARWEFQLTGENSCNRVFLGNQIPQRLFDAGDGRECGGELGVPFSGVANRIVRSYFTATSRLPAQAPKRFFQVQSAVVIGDFFAGGNIPHRNFEIEAGTETGCGAGMIDEAPMVPAQNSMASAVQVRVAVHLPAQQWRQGLEFRLRDDVIERITNPCNGTGRNETCGDQTVADVCVDEPEFRIWVDQDNNRNARCFWVCLPLYS
jgi:hypothetical protein